MDEFVECFFIFSILSVLLYTFLYREIDIISLCGNSTEPVTCGEDFCENLYQNEIEFEKFDVIQNIVNVFAKKKFFRGRYKKQSVVLKSLGSREQFEDLAKLYNLTFNQSDKYFQENTSIIKSKIVNLTLPNYVEILPKITLCSLDSVIIDRLLMKVLGYNEFSLKDFIHVWTMFQINPEPFLLKILNPLKWPTPKYYGVCGQILVVEDCGISLTAHYDSPWFKRANYTLQILESAFKFTFQDPDFVIYLTDVSPDNIAVNKDGNIKFIDLENVILMERKSIQGDTLIHKSIHTDCQDCFLFDPEKICSHAISDHNIYAVCKEILSDSSLLPKGFLHSNPPNFENLTILMEECITSKSRDRFQIALEIMKILKNSFNSH